MALLLILALPTALLSILVVNAAQSMASQQLDDFYGQPFMTRPSLKPTYGAPCIIGTRPTSFSYLASSGQQRGRGASASTSSSNGINAIIGISGLDGYKDRDGRGFADLNGAGKTASNARDHLPGYNIMLGMGNGLAGYNKGNEPATNGVGGTNMPNGIGSFGVEGLGNGLANGIGGVGSYNGPLGSGLSSGTSGANNEMGTFGIEGLNNDIGIGGSFENYNGPLSNGLQSGIPGGNVLGRQTPYTNSFRPNYPRASGSFSKSSAAAYSSSYSGSTGGFSSRRKPSNAPEDGTASDNEKLNMEDSRLSRAPKIFNYGGLVTSSTSPNQFSGYPLQGSGLLEGPSNFKVDLFAMSKPSGYGQDRANQPYISRSRNG